MPLIDVSIIVPFYNVGAAAVRCIESLVSQTFDADRYELVLVDDGSTDGTGRIIDDFVHGLAADGHTADALPLITLLHIDNCGLSAARNFGVRRCSGTFVTFVDGDDSVDPSYVERLWGGLSMLPEDARHPLVVCQYDYGDDRADCAAKHGLARLLKLRSGSGLEDSVTRGIGRRRRPAPVMGGSEAMNAVMYGEISLSAWGKLALRDEYVEHPFPEGRLYEDLSTIVRLIHDSSDIAVVDEPLYHYLIHDGSIVHSMAIDDRQIDDFILAIHEFTEQSGRFFRDDPDFDMSAFSYQRSLHCARLFTALGGCGHDRRMRASILRFVRGRLPGFIRNRRIPLRERLRLWLLCVCPPLYSLLFRLFVKVTRGVG